MGRFIFDIATGIETYEIDAYSIVERDYIPKGQGKAFKAALKAAQRPSEIHHETRQLRRAAERKARKGGA